MKIIFLGDIVGRSGCLSVKKNLNDIVKKNNINFVIVNGENAADNGLGITEKITNQLFDSGVQVITTGNHVWDHKETAELIENEKRLLRPNNLSSTYPGNGFEIFKTGGVKIGVLNLMGNVFMKKCEDVFENSTNFLNKYKLQEDFDLSLIHI